VTVIVALQCSDGIVLAADGQTTYASGMPMVSTRGKTKKLYALDGRVAWGAAGEPGLAQTLDAELRQLVGHLAGLDRDGVRAHLAGVVQAVQAQGFNQHVPHANTQQPQMACTFAWCSDDGTPNILVIPETGSNHYFAAPYAAVGSGTIFANVAMANFAHLDPINLNMEAAKVVMYRALDDMIKVAAFGLGPPISMYEITISGAVEIADPAADLTNAVDVWKAAEQDALPGGTPTPASAPGPDPGVGPPPVA
jgi:20S proteasome alpha/beta subunit